MFFSRWNKEKILLKLQGTLMLLACHKKSYLKCVKFSKYYVIFILIFFNVQNWGSQQGRDSCLKINKYYVIFRKFDTYQIAFLMTWKIKVSLTIVFCWYNCLDWLVIKILLHIYSMKIFEKNLYPRFLFFRMIIIWNY